MSKGLSMKNIFFIILILVIVGFYVLTPKDPIIYYKKGELKAYPNHYDEAIKNFN